MIFVKKWNHFFLGTQIIRLLLTVMEVDLVINTILLSTLRLQAYHQDVNGHVCLI